MVPSSTASLKKIKALIVDDEHIVASTIKEILNKLCPEVDIVGIANDAYEAKHKIELLKPNVIFLDITMPKLSGFDLLHLFHEKDFKIIFVTAYENYALDALKEGALAYILKPVLSNDIVDAISKVKHSFFIESQLKNDFEDKENSSEDSIIIKMNKEYVIIKHQNIVYLKVDRNYTEIVLNNDNKYLSAKPIINYEKTLPPQFFFRIHKSYIVNVSYITKYFYEGTISYVLLNNTIKLSIAQLKKVQFRKRITEMGFKK